MVLLAFSVQDQVQKYGAYVGIASFFGLALLSLLYFAQAREVRRLREWAGRSPERANELEERVVAQAESVRRVPPPARRPVPVPAQPVAAAATNGAHKLKPAEVAALAFARAAGVAEPPHPPKPAPVPQPVAVAAEAPPTEVAAGVATAGEPAVVPASGNGHGHGDVPAPATPAARRPEVRDAAAPLRATPPPRRPAPAPGRRPLSGPPPRRETSTRSVVLTGLLVVVGLVAVVFAGVKVLGGGGGGTTANKPQIPVVSPGATATPGSGSKKTAKPAATPSRGTTLVTVLNGTPTPSLAANLKDRLLTSGYVDNNVKADNDPTTKARPASLVLYKRGASAQAKDVAKVLAIADVKPIDAGTQGIAPTASVVVEVGADKSGN